MSRLMILSFSLTSSLCHSVSVILLHFQPKNSSFSKSLGRETKYVSRGQVVLHVELKANAFCFSQLLPHRINNLLLTVIILSVVQMLLFQNSQDMASKSFFHCEVLGEIFFIRILKVARRFSKTFAL